MDAISGLNAGLAGRYAIEREIGAGGMATVYLAQDLRHERQVALKVLKPELGAVVGAERFLSEIRVTAKLQHPNLLPLFDSGESAGLLYYVMPYVEGETLRHRLEREKQLPVDEALRLTIAICGALDYAHRHGVIHRDLKPENILLHDGQPMIADFGIALAISNAGGARLTLTGLSLGTPQYMSPEQAAGDRMIDARSDVYSVGALLYEMLAGEPPHTGPTAQAIIAKLMTEEPRSLTALRRSVPAHVDAAILRTLEKLPADRFSTAHEVADALSGKVGVAAPRESGHSRSLMTWRLATAGLAVVAAAAVIWAVRRGPGVAVPTPHFRFALGLPDTAAVDAGQFSRSIDLALDGTQLTYVGIGGLFIRPLNDLTPRSLTSEAVSDPRFSPDGAWVAYLANGTLRKVPVGGGAPVTIVDSVGRFGWSSKGTIVFTRSGTPVADLWRVSENGGPAERIVHQLRPNDRAYGTPSFLPDGDTFLVPTVSRIGDSTEIVAHRLSDGRTSYLGVRGDHPLYLDGILLSVGPDGAVLARALDARSLRVGAATVRVFQGVMRKQSSAELALSATGTMAYLPGQVPGRLVEVSRAGRERAVSEASGLFNNPRYSPDGRRVAVVVGLMASTDISIYDIPSSTMTRLTNNHLAGAPEWTADGKRVAWSQTKGALGMRAAELSGLEIHWRAVDASDSESALLPGGLGMSFAPKGGFALVVVVDKDGRGVLSRLELDSTRRLTRIMLTGGPPAARVSPDGRWVAYQATGADQTEVYVRATSGVGGQYPVSTAGGREPMWDPRGGELFYRVGQRLIAATLAFEGEPRVVRRDTLPFRLPRSLISTWASYDVSPDGQWFLMVKAAAASDQPIVVTGWLDEVRALLTAAR